MTKVKRLQSVLLALCMVLILLPLTATPARAELTEADLNDALTAAIPGGTVDTADFTTLDGPVTVPAGVTLIILHTLYNNSAITNDGTVTINGGAIINQNVGEFANNGTININNDRWFSNVGTLTNNGTIYINGTNNSSITDDSRIVNYNPTGAINNSGAGTININNGGLIRNFSTIENDGTINNGGRIMNENECEITGGGSITGSPPFTAYTITFDANGGLVTPVNGRTDADGKLASLPAPTKSDHTFDGWFTEDTGGTQVDTSTVFTANTTIFAQWTATPPPFPPANPGNSGWYEPPPENPAGSFSEGSIYTKGSGTGIVYTVDKDFSQFSNVLVGDTTLTLNTHYTALEGSTMITLLPAYLDALNAGTYTMRVNFNGGAHATVSFTVAEYETPFSDVAEDAWYSAAVEYVHRQGLMLGIADDRFSPDTELSRAMIVTILYRNEGEPDVSGLENPFSDILENEWYTDAVKWAYANEIVQGYGNGIFGTNAPVTKEQLATLIYRTQQSSGKIPPDILMDFVWPDWDNISEYAKGPVNVLTIQGIFRDIPRQDGFNPKTPATRAEVASILYRWLTAAD